MMQQQAQQELVKQTGQLAGTPLMDPSKNPEIANQMSGAAQSMIAQMAEQQADPNEPPPQ